MSDDISIPQPGPGPVRTSFTHSYRSRRTGMDSGTKRLLLAASALGCMLVGGMAVWSLTGHRTAGIPTIEADTRPLRVKPENPGGMTAIGASEQMLRGGDDGVGDLAPAAERPDPQALRAQREAAMAPAQPAPNAPAPAAGEPPVAGTKPPAAAEPAASTPQAPAPTPTSAPTPTPTPTQSAATGTIVQIAAVGSESGAMSEWQRLARKMPELLGERSPLVQKAEHDGKAIWRLRTGGFADVADATQFCQRVRAKGGGCALANF